MLILSSAYLPPVQYFVHLYRRGGCIIEQYEHYLKQTYRNRCVIDSPNGALALTIPVEKPADGKCLMKDIRISDHGNWRHLHWQAFVASYYNSPFFEYYQDDFRPFFEKKWDFLVDFNEEILHKCCELIDLQPEIIRSDSYVKTDEGGVDYRSLISPKNSVEMDNIFLPSKYYQVFQHKEGFKPNLSVADLIFNMGPESVLVLQSSMVKNDI